MHQVTDPPKEEQRQKIFLKSGRELTPELEEELAAEAERGYDLSKARWRIRTRPLLPGSPMPEIGLRLSQEECDAVCRRAEDEGRLVSEVLQEALEQQRSDP